MLKFLIQYFAKNGELILPNIGRIKYHKEEASWVNAQLLAPKETIVFESIDVKPTDQFYHFLANSLNLSFEQAKMEFEAYLKSIFQNEVPHFEFGNYGTLSKGEHLYQWTSNFNSITYLNSIDIAPIVNSTNMNANHFSQSSKWKLWAILIAIVAIILILFKFLKVVTF